MGFFSSLFGGAKPPPPVAVRPSQLPADATLGELDSQAATRRELVRMLTRDTLRSSGIPEGWMESQILLELGRGAQTFIHLRLVVKQWDERLLKYAVAFQRKLRSEVERFEPSAREWLLSITWQYEVGEQCPYLKLPDPAEWAITAEVSAVNKEEQEMQADLARLFAVRDANLTESSWEATQVAGLPGAGPSAAGSRGHPRP